MNIETLWVAMGCLVVGYVIGRLAERSGSRVAPRAPVERVAPDKIDPVILELLRDGQKIQAIKHYRTLYRVDLKEAKDAVDALEEGIR